MFFVLLEIARDVHIDIYLNCIYIIHIHTKFDTFTFAFIALGSHIRFCKINFACDVSSPSMKFSSLQY